MTTGAVTLAQIATSRDALAVHCDRCDRSGRYRLATLIDRFGRDCPLPEVAASLEEGCDRKGQIGGCFVTFPDLV